MFLKSGTLALALLIVSRFTGLWRESALAATLGVTGFADAAIVMLTFPDWLTAIVAGGALGYVLLPHWAQQTPRQRALTHLAVGQWLLFGSVALALLVAMFRHTIAQWMAPGLTGDLLNQTAQGVAWAAFALPAAFLASLGITRLQYEQDFVGMYSANLVVNSVLVLVIYLLAVPILSDHAANLLGLGLVLAAGLRLLWVQWRVRARSDQDRLLPDEPLEPLPKAHLWAWGILAAGLPLTLPIVARSVASLGGTGALATFNYAWKLVELPLVLAIQLVTALAFPSIVQAFAASSPGQPQDSTAGHQAVRGALALAWTVACACAIALQIAAPAIASLLFGWGSMPSERLVVIAAWGAAGAWGLLPQALIAVILTVLAAQGRLWQAVGYYAVALFALIAFVAWGEQDGIWLMRYLNIVLTGTAVAMLFAVKRSHEDFRAVATLIPWSALVAPVPMLIGWQGAAWLGWAPYFSASSGSGLWLGLGAALCVGCINFMFSRDFRLALRR